jgi:calcium-dependent protein kinase
MTADEENSFKDEI